MAGPVSLRFVSAPALWRSYATLLLRRKPRYPEQLIPRIEASLGGVSVDPRHLDRYRRICSERASNELPIAYPHVLATPIHLAMVASEAFPISLFGVVHVRNRIELRRPLRLTGPGELRASIEGRSQNAHGQEIELRTQFCIDGETVWTETSTLLARRTLKRPARWRAPRAPAAQTPPTRCVRHPLSVTAGTGRRYASVSGDFNPIHIANLSARLFGFKHAIAHGMWSLARCVGELGPESVRAPCTLDVAFKLPIAFPAQVVLESWSVHDGLDFALRDDARERGHLLGSIRWGTQGASSE